MDYSEYRAGHRYNRQHVNDQDKNVSAFHFAVLGGGSIGQRHARNLIALSQSNVRIIETVPEQAEKLKTESFTVFTEPEAAFAPEVEAVLICSPTTYHQEQTRTALQHGKHVFIEKPISHVWEGVDELVSLAENAGVVTLVGFNMRFRDGFLRAKAFLDEGHLGKPLAARANVSYYLPHYHPHLDYRTRYQAQKALGGGVMLDDIHEIDYLTALFGSVTEVFAYVENLSDLEMDAEDFAALTLKHAGGVVTQLQMDFLSRVYRRTLEITGSEATLTLDHNTGEIRLYGPQDHQYAVYPQKMSVTVNQMYLDEMSHFIRCLEGKETPIADISAGREALRVALAAFESAQKGQVVRL
jgi:predicted dehydrogenase